MTTYFVGDPGAAAEDFSERFEADNECEAIRAFAERNAGDLSDSFPIEVRTDPAAPGSVYRVSIEIATHVRIRPGTR